MMRLVLLWCVVWRCALSSNPVASVDSTHVKGVAQHANSATCHCSIDTEFQYESAWSDTALTVCQDVVPNPSQHVCVVGGGMSGVHFSWLLHRRGFTNISIFEKASHLGGKAHTVSDAGGVPRELGGAYLSPDYYETRALLRRFNMSEIVVDKPSMVRFHWNTSRGTASEWYSELLMSVTKSSDPNENEKLVNAALQKYFSLHVKIFGNYSYKSRFPPRPVDPELISGTAADFLYNNGLEVLWPFMYEFVTLQGMGLLEVVPAYYMLKWVSPATLAAPGPVMTMLKEGFGGILEALFRDASLSVNFNATVVGITRSQGEKTKLQYQGPTGVQTTSCDLVVLSGPIPQYVQGVAAASIPPILTPALANEVTQFGSMKASEWLVSLVKFKDTPTSPYHDYKTVEMWPDLMSESCATVERRNVAYSETNISGPFGGIMSYSFSSKCNRTMQMVSQQQWAADQGLEIQETYDQFFTDSYGFHYNTTEVEYDGKPWTLDQMQMQNGTIYVGGAAAWESVEDILESNLALVDRLFPSKCIS